MSEWTQIGKVQFKSDAYGQAMTEIQQCLKESGFRFKHDPVDNMADLEMKVNGGGE